MTQNADIIRQLATVIAKVDVAPAEVVSEFIKLERADATKVCDMLKDMFEKGGQPSTQPGIRSVRVPPNVPQPVPVENEISGATGLSEERSWWQKLSSRLTSHQPHSCRDAADQHAVHS